jgi:hypothetical protein
MAYADTGQTWFFHAGVYSAALGATHGDVALLEARCPRCAVAYVTVVDSGEPNASEAVARTPLEVEAAVAAAEATLDRECPDHPHRFVVGEA